MNRINRNETVGCTEGARTGKENTFETSRTLGNESQYRSKADHEDWAIILWEKKRGKTSIGKGEERVDRVSADGVGRYRKNHPQ